MPYIVQVRTDIPEGILQVLDLRPNTSQRSLIYEPPPQTKYLRRVQNDTVAVTGTTTTAEYKGVAAWLIDTIEDSGDGGALTATEANTIADALIAEADAGNALTVSDVNTVIQLTVAASGIGVGNSTGTLDELLKILAGAEFILPAGSSADSGAGNFDAATEGSFTEGQYRATYSHGALNISLGEGDLATLTASTFEYSSVTGAAVVVYDDDGSVL